MIKETNSYSNFTSSLSREQIEQVIFSIVGLIIVVVAIPGLLGLFAYHRSLDSLNSDLTVKIQATASLRSYLVGYIAKIIIGLFLLCFPNIVAGLPGRVRGIFNRQKSI